MKGEITFDLAMKEDMPFVEGCYRLDDGIWHVFMVRKSRGGIEAVGVRKNLRWESGVTGVNIIVGDEERLDKARVIAGMSEALGVAEWTEVHGPDSMKLR